MKRTSPAPSGRCGRDDSARLVEFVLGGSSAALGTYFLLLSHCLTDQEPSLPEDSRGMVCGRLSDGIMTLIAGTGDVITGEYGPAVVACVRSDPHRSSATCVLTITPEGTGSYAHAWGRGVLHIATDRVGGRISAHLSVELHPDQGS